MATTSYLELFLGRRDVLSEEERSILRALPAERRAFGHGAQIVAEGKAPEGSCLLISGMAMRAHRLGGSQRVVSAVHVAGDFIDLHATFLDHLDHDIVAVGSCIVEFIDGTEIESITREHPHLTRLLWLSTLIDAKLHRMWIVLRSGLLAHKRIGHLMCELHARLSIVGLVEDDRFALPLDQRGLAEVLGYSVVHTNKAVQTLRGEGLLHWDQGRVHLPDPEALAAYCNFDPAYLEYNRCPR